MLCCCDCMLVCGYDCVWVCCCVGVIVCWCVGVVVWCVVVLLSLCVGVWHSLMPKHLLPSRFGGGGRRDALLMSEYISNTKTTESHMAFGEAC